MRLFPEAEQHSIDIGKYIQISAGYCTDGQIYENATSGGIVTAIASYMLKKGCVKGVVTTRTIYTGQGPRSQTFIATNEEELCKAQGSKYCPTPALSIMDDVIAWDGPLAFIGTPCQIAGMRLLQARNQDLSQKIKICIGIFCGGYRDLRETTTLIRRSGFMERDIVEFRYRYGGQPGYMLIVDGKGKRHTMAYPDYSRRTGYIKHKRCRLCVDATAELADISCGDGWLERLNRDSNRKWSLIIVRSNFAKNLITSMVECGSIVQQPVTLQELIVAQAGNLDSKKNRYLAKMRLYKMLGSQVPYYDGGYHENARGVFSELKIFARQHILLFIELSGLYPVIARMLKRY